MKKSIFKLSVILLLTFIVSYTQAQTLEINFESATSSQMEGDTTAPATGLSNLIVSGAKLEAPITVYILAEPGDTNPIQIENENYGDIVTSTIIPVVIPAKEYRDEANQKIPVIATAENFNIIGDTIIEQNETIKLTLLNSSEYTVDTSTKTSLAPIDRGLLMTGFSFELIVDDNPNYKRRISNFTPYIQTHRFKIGDNNYVVNTQFIFNVINIYNYKKNGTAVNPYKISNLIIKIPGEEIYTSKRQATSVHTLINDDDSAATFLAKLEKVTTTDINENATDAKAQFKVILYDKAQNRKATTADTLPTTDIIVYYNIGGDVRAGKDFTDSSSVTIPSGALEKAIDIPILNDDDIEFDNTLTLELQKTNSSMVEVSQMKDEVVQSITIKSDERLTVTVNNSRYLERLTGDISPTVQVTGGVVPTDLLLPITIQARVTDGTATSSGTNPDYAIEGAVSGGMIVFSIPPADYTMEKKVAITSIKILGDNTEEVDETFTMALSLPTKGEGVVNLPATPQTFTIVNDDGNGYSLQGFDINFVEKKTSQGEGIWPNSVLTGFSNVEVKGGTLTTDTNLYISVTDELLINKHNQDVPRVITLPIPQADYSVIANQIINLSEFSAGIDHVRAQNEDLPYTLTLLSPANFFLYSMNEIIHTDNAVHEIKTTLQDFDYIEFKVLDVRKNRYSGRTRRVRINKSDFNAVGIAETIEKDISAPGEPGGDYKVTVTYKPTERPLVFEIKVCHGCCKYAGFADVVIKGNTGNAGFTSTKNAVSIHTIKDSSDTSPPEGTLSVNLEKVTTGDVNEMTTDASVQFKVKVYKTTGTSKVAAVAADVTAAFRVYYTVNQGTATVDQDFTDPNNRHLDFSIDEFEKTLEFPILDDNIPEEDETLTVVLLSEEVDDSGMKVDYYNGGNTKSITIKSDDKLTVSLTDMVDSKLKISVTGGDASNYKAAMPLQVTVNGGTASRTGEDADYTFIDGAFNTPFTVNIPPADYTNTDFQMVDIPFIRINRNKEFASDKTIIMSAMTSSPALRLSSDPYTYTYTIESDVPISALTINFADATTSQAEGNSNAVVSGISELSVSGVNLAKAKTVYILAEPGGTNPVEVDDITYRDMVSAVVIPVAIPPKDYTITANQPLSLMSMVNNLRIVGDTRDEGDETIKLTLLKPSENFFYSMGTTTSTPRIAHTFNTPFTDFTTISFEVVDIRKTGDNPEFPDRRYRLVIKKADLASGTYKTDIRLIDNSDGDYPTMVTSKLVGGFYSFSIYVQRGALNENGGFTNLIVKGSTNIDDFVSTQLSSVHTLTDDDDPQALNVGLEAVAPSVNESDMNAKAQFRMKVYKQDGSEAATADVTAAITVSYRLSGTATKGTDFTSDITTSTIPAGTVSKNIDFPIISDSISEGDETIIMTLIGASPATVEPSTTAFTQTVSIIDIVPGQFYVKLETVTTGDVSESATPAIAQFKVKVYKTADNMPATVSDLTDAGLTAGFDVTYTISGDVSDTDYTTPDSKTVTFAAREVEKTFSITIRNDTEVERDESLTVTLGVPSSLAVILSANSADNTKSVTITSEDAYTIKLEKVTVEDNIAEKPIDSAVPNKAEFKAVLFEGMSKVTASVLNEPVTITYTVAGTAREGIDFSEITTKTVSLNTGNIEASIEVTLLDDNLIEDNETVIVTLTAPASTDTTAKARVSTTEAEIKQTVTVTSEDKLTISIENQSVVEGSGDHDESININITGADLTGYTTPAVTVMVTIANGMGTNAAMSPTDYSVNSSTGATRAVGTAFPLTILPKDYTQTANQTISIADVVSIKGNELKEGNKEFSVRLSGATPTAIAEVESSKSTATYTINDDDGELYVKLIKVTTGDVAENPTDPAVPNKAQFKIEVYKKNNNSKAVASEVTSAFAVTYTIEGTATVGEDYTDTTTKTVNFMGGEVEKAINVTVLDDDKVEVNETLMLTITETNASDISLSATTEDLSKSITITSEDFYTIKLEKVTVSDSIGENDADAKAQFKAVLYEGTAKATASVLTEPVTITYTVAGTAREGIDYSEITTKTVSLTTGNIEASIEVTLLDDNLIEDNETVIVTLTAPASTDTTAKARVSATEAEIKQTVTVTSEDKLTVSIENQSVAEGNVNHDESININVTGADLTGYTTPAVTVMVTIDNGTGANAAVSPTHYSVNALTGTTRAVGTAFPLTILPKDYTQTANQTISIADVVNIKGNELKEGNKEFSVRLSGATPTAIAEVESSKSTAAYTINDDDGDLYVKLTKVTTGDVAENPTDPAVPNKAQFKIEVYKKNNNSKAVASEVTSAFAVTYTIEGTATVGEDYTDTTTKTVNFMGGEVEKAINVTVLDDDKVEANETLMLTITKTNASGVSLSATPEDLSKSITITSEDFYTIKLEKVTVSDSIAENDADAKAQFKAVLYEGTAKATASVLPDPLTITYTVAGTAAEGEDYTSIDEKSVSLAANSLEQPIDIMLINDNRIEDDETIIVTLTGPAAADTTAKARISTTEAENTQTVTVTSEDKLTISVENQTVAEGNENHDAPVKIKVAGADLTGYTTPKVTVMVTVADGTGTNAATSPGDYTLNVPTGTTREVGTAFSFTIPEADYTQESLQSIAVATVNIKGNAVVAESKQFTVSLSSPAPAPITMLGTNSAAYTISNDDSSLYVKLEKISGDKISEKATGTDPNLAQFRIKVYKATDDTAAVGADVTTAFEVTYTIAGTTRAGEDYTDINQKTVAFAIGDFEKNIDITVLDDLAIEGDETLTINLQRISGTAVGLSKTNADIEKSVTITSDETYVLKLVKVTSGDINENTTDAKAQFKVDLYLGEVRLSADGGNLPKTPITVTYTLTGTAMAGSDYTDPATKQVTINTGVDKVLDIAILDDNEREENETLIMTLVSTTGNATKLSDNSAEITQSYTIISDEVVLGIPQEWLNDSKSIDTSVPSQVLSLSGENNALQIAGLAETNKVFIYNRIGELVWNTEDYPQGGVLTADSDNYFRGISNIHGNTLPTGTYFMVIENYLPSGTKVTSHIIVIIE